MIKILIANKAHDCWLKSIIGDFGVLLTKLYRKTGTVCSVCSKCSFNIVSLNIFVLKLSSEHI